MNTFENTIYDYEELPGIQALPGMPFRRQETECPFPLMEKKEILKDLEMSRQQAETGNYQEAGEFIAELRNEYGI